MILKLILSEKSFLPYEVTFPGSRHQDSPLSRGPSFNLPQYAVDSGKRSKGLVDHSFLHSFVQLQILTGRPSSATKNKTVLDLGSELATPSTITLKASSLPLGGGQQEENS